MSIYVVTHKPQIQDESHKTFMRSCMRLTLVYVTELGA